MRKISVKEIVDFRRKSDRARYTFVLGLKNGGVKRNTGGGGDYWVCAESALIESYKKNDDQPIFNKIEALKEKQKVTVEDRTKIMYKRNIDVLSGILEVDFGTIRPRTDIKFLKKDRNNAQLNIKGIEIQVSPNHIFEFISGDIKQIGAIWFVSKLEGFKVEELGLFLLILYRYLSVLFSKQEHISSEYCVIVDVYKGTSLSYFQFMKDRIPQLLDSSLDEINRLLM